MAARAGKGERSAIRAYRIEIVDPDPRRVKRVAIHTLRKAEGGEAEAAPPAEDPPPLLQNCHRLRQARLAPEKKE
jgi:hypothetical protein